MNNYILLLFNFRFAVFAPYRRPDYTLHDSTYCVVCTVLLYIKDINCKSIPSPAVDRGDRPDTLPEAGGFIRNGDLR